MLLLFLVAISISAPQQSASPPPPQTAEVEKVAQVISRTKVVSATYAVYYWNHGRSPSLAAADEWSAEFNSGSLHRVETPRDRVVADCKAGTGAYLNVASGQVTRGPGVAAAACGINTNRQIVAAKWVGRVQSYLAAADRIQITDSSNIRTYDISDDGVILASVYALRDPQQSVELETFAVSLTPALPDQSMFDEASLQKSFVPERYKTAPLRRK
jgi:hypothetical protein